MVLTSVLNSAHPTHETPGSDTHNELRETLGKLSKRFHSMISVYDMAHAPVVLGVHDRFQQATRDHGTFDARTRKTIALAVAAASDCAVCWSAHLTGYLPAGWTPQQIAALRAGERIAGEEKITALLAVARQFVGAVGRIDEGIWRQALQTGWTTEELAELFTHVLANIFANYLDHFTRDQADSSATFGFPAASA